MTTVLNGVPEVHVLWTRSLNAASECSAGEVQRAVSGAYIQYVSITSTARRPINTRAASLKRLRVDPSNLIRLIPAEGFETAPCSLKILCPFIFLERKVEKIIVLPAVTFCTCICCKTRPDRIHLRLFLCRLGPWPCHQKSL